MDKALLTKTRQFIIIGNPNVGKSVLFGCLANKYVTVSNYPGTTVTVTKGWMETSSGPVPIIDTPGVNNLTPYSEDELVTRNIITEAHPCDKVIQVLDAKNLRRGLFLAIQLSEMRSCGLLALNMWDEAAANGFEIDLKKLREIFGVPCLPTIAIHKKGVNELKKQECHHFQFRITYPQAIEEGMKELSSILPSLSRGLALMALSGDETFIESLKEKYPSSVMARLEEIREQTERRLNTDIRSAVDKKRMAEAERIERLVLHRTRSTQRNTLWSKIGQWSTHPWGGFVILGIVLVIMYQFVGVFGAGTLVDLVETKMFNHWLNPGIIHAFDRLMPFPHGHILEDGVATTKYAFTSAGLTWLQGVFRFVHDFFVGEFGLITMALTYGFAIIFPVILTFFIAFGMMEDFGYLPRLSILLNRVFKKIGLNGKAVLPMILGLGCDTMATVTARILDTNKERMIVTFLLALAVPCSAQLGVIMFLLVDGVGPKGVAIWTGIVLIVLFAAGYLASRLIRGDSSSLILEIPPFRRPSLKNILQKTLARVEWYLREVIPIFVIGTALLFLLKELHLLGIIERGMKPLVVGWLQLPTEGARAILMGFFRRDYGAAGFIQMFEDGQMSKAQILVGVTTITLFVPCIANALVMIKERGTKVSVLMIGLVILIAFGVGGTLARILPAVTL